MKIDKTPLPEDGAAYKNSKPFTACILDSFRLNELSSGDEVRHIVLDISESGIKYLEGQSIGIIPPGTRENGKPHKPRLYSIASKNSGDDGTKTSVSLCVKRTLWKDENSDEIIQGLCSNYLCDLKKGDEVLMTGPSGRSFLLPTDWNIPFLFFSVGTGIAPFKGFIDRIISCEAERQNPIYFYFGAKHSSDLLYLNQVNNDLCQASKERNFPLRLAISREQIGDLGERIYIKHRLQEDISTIWPIIKSGQFALYICGLKGMEKGIDAVLEQEAEKEGMNWKEIKKQFRLEGRWNLEVY